MREAWIDDTRIAQVGIQGSSSAAPLSLAAGGVCHEVWHAATIVPLDPADRRVLGLATDIERARLRGDADGVRALCLLVVLCDGSDVGQTALRSHEGCVRRTVDAAIERA